MTELLDLPRYDPTHWQLDAVCFRLGVDPNVMQPEKASREEVAEALALCDGCPVRQQCADHALEQGPQHPGTSEASAYGIHGGEWFGHDPVWMEDRDCEAPGCRESFRVPESGPQRFCSAACRQRDRRARKASA